MKARISVRLVRINLYMYYNYSLSISFRMLRYKLHILEAYIFIDIVERPIYHKHYWYYFTLTYLKVGNTLHLSRLPINGLEQCLYFVYFALNCLINIMSLKKNLHWCMSLIYFYCIILLNTFENFHLQNTKICFTKLPRRNSW